MEELRTVITAACMLSIAIGLCNMLRPSRQFEQQIRFLISLLFAVCLAGPLLRMDLTLAPPEADMVRTAIQAEQITDTAQELILTETAEKTEAALCARLAENGITCPELKAEIHIDDKQRIYISEISAVCSDTVRAGAILRSDLGEEVTLHVAQLDTEAFPEG